MRGSLNKDHGLNSNRNRRACRERRRLAGGLGESFSRNLASETLALPGTSRRPGGCSPAGAVIGALPGRVGWRISVLPKMKPPDFSHELNRLMDPYWRKARIAARLLLKREAGKPWSARDRRLATKLSNDRGVTNRLLDQAYYSHRARKRNGRSILDIIP